MVSLFQAEIAKTSSPEFNTEYVIICDMEAEINATDNIFLYLQLYRSRSTIIIIVVYESSI